MTERSNGHSDYTFRGNGGDLVRLFDPRVVHAGTIGDRKVPGLSDDMLRPLVAEARKNVFAACQEAGCADHITNNKGRYEITGEAAEALHKIGGAVASVLAHPTEIRLPDLREERRAFTAVLTESALHHEGNHQVVVPVCPDYGKGAEFYRSMGGGVSPEAQAAITATRVLKGEYSDYLNPEVTIIVANTERDIPEIMQNTSQGDTEVYNAYCESSAQAVRNEIAGLEGVSVYTFTQFLGTEFTSTQKAYEGVIRELMERDPGFNARVTGIAEQRVARHSQILAREEQAYELTVRYMAQYMTLGRMARTMEGPVLLMNYQTPNREYYNAFANIHAELKLPDDSTKVVPVLGTFAKR